MKRSSCWQWFVLLAFGLALPTAGASEIYPVWDVTQMQSSDAASSGDPPDAASSHPEGQAPGHTPAPNRGRISADALARMTTEAESLYRAGRWAAAMDAFREIVAADSGNAAAWLRIGNLHQRRRQLTAAASAYRRAASDARREAQLTAPRNTVPAGTDSANGANGSNGRAGTVATPDDSLSASPLQPSVRARALVNLALVNLELAETALAAYDRETVAAGQGQGALATAPARAALARDIQAADKRARAAQRVLPAAGVSSQPQGAGDAPGSTPPPSPRIEYLKGAPTP